MFHVSNAARCKKTPKIFLFKQIIYSALGNFCVRLMMPINLAALDSRPPTECEEKAMSRFKRNGKLSQKSLRNYVAVEGNRVQRARLKKELQCKSRRIFTLSFHFTHIGKLDIYFYQRERTFTRRGIFGICVIMGKKSLLLCIKS